MAEAKTKPTNQSAQEFIAGIENTTRRKDALAVLQLMTEITRQPATLWGSSIIGFGQYHYQYESGCQGDGMKIGFSPRKANLVLYLMNGFNGYEALLKKLGKHKVGKSCLYTRST